MLGDCGRLNGLLVGVVDCIVIFDWVVVCCWYDWCGYVGCN